MQNTNYINEKRSTKKKIHICSENIKNWHTKGAHNTLTFYFVLENIKTKQNMKHPSSEIKIVLNYKHVECKPLLREKSDW